MNEKGRMVSVGSGDWFGVCGVEWGMELGAEPLAGNFAVNLRNTIMTLLCWFFFLRMLRPFHGLLAAEKIFFPPNVTDEPRSPRARTEIRAWLT
jgi:hypothetical protein